MKPTTGDLTMQTQTNPFYQPGIGSEEMYEYAAASGPRNAAKPYSYAVRFAYATESHQRGEIVSFHRTRFAAERAAKRCALPTHVEIAEL